MKTSNPLIIKIDNNQLTVGERAKFTDRWIDNIGNVLPPDREYLVLDRTVKLVNWQDGGPPEVIAPQPDGTLPDPRELNSKIDQANWGVDLNGEPRPPWCYWYITVFLDAINARLFTFGNSTVGSAIAFGELDQRIKLMCALQGSEVLAVVRLRDAPMKTKHSPKPRPRPFYEVVGWRQFKNGELQIADQTAASTLEEVKPMPLGVTLKDQIPF